MIAAASVGSALRGVGWMAKSGRTLTELLRSLKDITGIEEVRVTVLHLRKTLRYITFNKNN